MNLAEFTKAIEKPAPVYLLVAPDDYSRSQVLEVCEQRVEPSARTFNWAVFNLSDDSPEEVVGVARTLPWMTTHRWVYVRNAEMGEKVLAKYLEDPSPRTVLVLEASKAVKSWKGAIRVETGRGQNATAWIRQQVQSQGYSIDPRAASMLVEMTGEDLQELNSELEKLFLLELEGRKITIDSVLQLTMEAREKDIFDLINAIATRRRDVALRVLERLLSKGAAPQQIIPMLYWSFSRLLVARERLDRRDNFDRIVRSLKIFSYRGKERQIRNYSHHFLTGLVLKMREVDRLCKTTSVDPRSLLERVIVDMCRV